MMNKLLARSNMTLIFGCITNQIYVITRGDFTVTTLFYKPNPQQALSFQIR